MVIVATLEAPGDVPSRPRESSTEDFNAVGESNPLLARICPGLRVAVIIVGLAEVSIGGLELAKVAVEGVQLAGVISGLDDASKDLPAAAVAGVELAEVGRSMRLAIMIQAAASLKAFLCMMYSSMRCVLNSGLSSVNS